MNLKIDRWLRHKLNFPIGAGDRVVFIGIHGEKNLKGTVLANVRRTIWVKWDTLFHQDVVSVNSVERILD